MANQLQNFIADRILAARLLAELNGYARMHADIAETTPRSPVVPGTYIPTSKQIRLEDVVEIEEVYVCALSNGTKLLLATFSKVTSTWLSTIDVCILHKGSPTFTSIRILRRDGFFKILVVANITDNVGNGVMLTATVPISPSFSFVGLPTLTKTGNRVELDAMIRQDCSNIYYLESTEGRINWELCCANLDEDGNLVDTAHTALIAGGLPNFVCESPDAVWILLSNVDSPTGVTTIRVNTNNGEIETLPQIQGMNPAARAYVSINHRWISEGVDTFYFYAPKRELGKFDTRTYSVIPIRAFDFETSVTPKYQMDSGCYHVTKQSILFSKGTSICPESFCLKKAYVQAPTLREIALARVSRLLRPETRTLASRMKIYSSAELVRLIQNND